MASVPAAPAAPQRDAVRAWQDAYRSVSKDLNRWAKRVGNGQDPLLPGELSQLSSLIKAAENLLDVGPVEAQITAGVWNASMRASQDSLLAAAKAIPPHVYATASEVDRQIGWNRVVNKSAYQAVINNQVGQLTSDFNNLTLEQQQKLATDLANAVASGGNPRELSQAVKGTVTEWFRTGQSRSLMISRTNMARAYDAASFGLYKDAAGMGLVKGWKWVANGKKPCPACQALHGAIFRVDEGMYRHPNCTCTNVPVLMDEKGTVGERVNPRPDTNPDDLELWQSDSGWVTWRVAPANPTGRAKGRVIQRGIKDPVSVPVGPVKVPAVAAGRVAKKAARKPVRKAAARRPAAASVKAQPVKKAARAATRKVKEQAPKPPKVNVPESPKAKYGVDRWTGDDYARAKELTKEWKPTYTDRVYDPEKGLGPYKVPEDMMLKSILKDQGFDAPPTVVSKAEFAELKDSGLQYLGRGMTGDSPAELDTFVETFKFGEDFNPRGMFGSGTYASPTQDVLDYFSKYTAGGEERPHGTIMNMLIKPDAKVVDFDEVRKRSSELQEGRMKYMNDGDPLYLFMDQGRTAAMEGIDIVRIPSPTINGQKLEGTDYYLVLNRGALIVEDKT